MNAIRTTPPAPGEQPTWSEHWNEVHYEWQLAAREVCQLNDRVQTVAGTYLGWRAGELQPGETPWWHTELDWSQFARDLKKRGAGLSSGEKALARVAIGLAQGRGEFEYEALRAAGYLNEVLMIVQRCAEDIDEGGTRA